MHLKRHKLIANELYNFLCECSFGNIYSVVKNLAQYPDRIQNSLNEILDEAYRK